MQSGKAQEACTYTPHACSVSHILPQVFSVLHIYTSHSLVLSPRNDSQEFIVSQWLSEEIGRSLCTSVFSLAFCFYSLLVSGRGKLFLIPKILGLQYTPPDSQLYFSQLFHEGRRANTCPGTYYGTTPVEKEDFLHPI